MLMTTGLFITMYTMIVCIYQCTAYIPIRTVEDTLVIVVNVYYPTIAISKPRRNANVHHVRPARRSSFLC